MEKQALIGRGRTADIYAWQDNKVLKLFNEWWPGDSVAYELKIARIVEAAGLPVPAVEDVIIEVEGRRGIIYERVSGPSMLGVLRARPWKARQFGRLMAELQAAIHRCSVPELPRVATRLQRAIQETPTLPSLMRQAALKALEQRPDGNALCHADFHPDNIIMTEQGPRVVDWMTAVKGNPLSDVARSSLILRLGEVPPGTRGRWVFNLIRAAFHSAYLNHYLFIRSAMRQDVDAWQLPIAAARLREDIPSERGKLLRLIEESIKSTARVYA
ncbi:MAG: phosphotransferase [Chloroflexi bacterium]|nr:phosphotransferase [Chloroflexota bacterium]